MSDFQKARELINRDLSRIETLEHSLKAITTENLLLKEKRDFWIRMHDDRINQLEAEVASLSSTLAQTRMESTGAERVKEVESTNRVKLLQQKVASLSNELRDVSELLFKAEIQNKLLKDAKEQNYKREDQSIHQLEADLRKADTREIGYQETIKKHLRRIEQLEKQKTEKEIVYFETTVKHDHLIQKPHLSTFLVQTEPEEVRIVEKIVHLPIVTTTVIKDMESMKICQSLQMIVEGFKRVEEEGCKLDVSAVNRVLAKAKDTITTYKASMLNATIPSLPRIVPRQKAKRQHCPVCNRIPVGRMVQCFLCLERFHAQCVDLDPSKVHLALNWCCDTCKPTLKRPKFK